MPQEINLKKNNKRLLLGRQLAIIIISIVATTVGIRAADKYFNAGNGGETAGKCPEGMVSVLSPKGDFCIDKFEASAGDNCQNPDPQSETQTRENLDKNNCIPVSAPSAKPWRFISQNQAAIACARAGKRLPTNQEWQLAALGTMDSKAEWGSDDCQVANNWATQPGATGSGKDCVSASGAYDMIGNLWEWTDGTAYEGQFDSKALPDQGYVTAVSQDAMPSETSSQPSDSYYSDYLYLKKTGTRAIARGGYWNNKEQAGIYTAYVVSLPSNTEPGIGFRCVK